MQEFDFVIKYRKDCQNGNTDALSRNLPSPVTAATRFVSDPIKKDIQQAQQADPILQIVYEAVQKPRCRPTSVSAKDNNCLLVVQDYFMKWADAIPLSNQKAITITKALVNLFATMGIPQIVHSNQGQNFKSTVLKQTLDVFGIQKSHTTAYHPQGDGLVERFNCSLLQLLRAYVDKEFD